MEKKETKYYLGLDIGIGSVGWAIIGEENGEHWLEDFGVRLFNAPEESKNKKSLAEKRREFRGKRRLLNRWHCRREDLRNFFIKIFGDNFLQESEKFAKNSTNLLEVKYNENKFFNPYVVRYQALNNKVDLVELLHILLHFSKYRGYKEFYLDDSPENSDEDAKETKNAVKATDKLREEFKEKNGRYPYSIAELVVKSEKFRHFDNKSLLGVHNRKPKENVKNKREIEKNLRNFIFPRQLLEEEVQKILEKQAEYYPQLKKKFTYTLWENKEAKNYELLASEIIKKIIFRQRDFEDGPTKTKLKNQEGKETTNWNKERTHWKKHNRNIASKSFTETTGYCQYFPAERRGWRCSIIYGCYQFINEFSKIGGLEEKELGGMEKVKEIHQRVFEWLLSPLGYKPTEKSKMKKQLKEFLKKENVDFGDMKKEEEKDKHAFKNINFETDFLDYLKESSSFYSALWKSCPSQFYLKYEIYQGSVFYKIGEVIFKNITERRRKKELDKLTKEYSLEPFQTFLNKLEKYDKERSPSSVSFPYMIETIKAFFGWSKIWWVPSRVQKKVGGKIRT